jgi:pimeloyl-ACP methyl ester carboxylesterase
MENITLTTPTHPRRATLRWLGLRTLSIVGLVLLIALGWAAGIATFFGLARFASSIPLLSSAALLVLFALTYGAVWLVARRFPVKRRHRFAIRIAAGSGVLLSVLATALVFLPLQVTAERPQPRSDTRYWSLPTGSRLAYTHFPALGPVRPTPVIFLHGGPGTPPSTRDYDFYRQLTQDGYDVYLYEQVGVGRSERLDAVERYSWSRNVADLEAIRQEIGAEQLVLIGQSGGGILMARYMAAYPQAVARAIFVSPGPMWQSLHVTPDRSRTAAADQPAGGLEPLRILTAVLLMRINPAAAQNLVSQDELGFWFDDASSGPHLASYCKGVTPPAGEPEPRGANFYVTLVTQRDEPAAADPHPALRENRTPALILTGECNYVPWRATVDYRDTLPNARLLYVPDAGHSLIGAQPALTLEAMRAFLLDQPLPLTPYTSSDEPSHVQP